eukprot:TRINITY_DN909_c1_g1_i1.p1 TRINITY_DN909_c1_g1~~TRINITY_DN909_c1_g1_i1.p1  ORF type:complete len:513 (+),score=65.63 TRINITY_DN909_c1_g1_i1:92-1540(+)
MHPQPTRDPLLLATEIDDESSSLHGSNKPDDGLNVAMLKTTVCRHWSKGHCKFGEECGFAHGGTELRKPLKTALCRHFEQGKCRKGNKCGFAHGAEELGTPQPELLTIDSQEPLDPMAANLPSGDAVVPPNKLLVLSLKKKVWRYCTIADQDEFNIKVHYDGYSKQFDEWLPIDSSRISEAAAVSCVESPPNTGAKVIVLSRRKRIWRECTIIDSDLERLKVHYDGYNDDYDEWLLRSSERLRTYDSSRLIGMKKTGLLEQKPTTPEMEPQVVKKSLKQRFKTFVSGSRPAGTANIPEDLYVFCTHPTGMQSEGHYVLVPGKTINKMPYWEAVGTTKIIYSSQRGAWMIGVHDWVETNNGWLSCKDRHYGSFPNQASVWRSYLTPADPWAACDAVVGLTPQRPAPSPSLSIPETVSDGAHTPCWTATPPPRYNHSPTYSQHSQQMNGSFSSNPTGGSPLPPLQQSISSVGSLSVSRHDPYAF